MASFALTNQHATGWEHAVLCNFFATARKQRSISVHSTPWENATAWQHLKTWEYATPWEHATP
jgi:hypothetical protein